MSTKCENPRGANTKRAFVADTSVRVRLLHILIQKIRHSWIEIQAVL